MYPTCGPLKSPPDPVFFGFFRTSHPILFLFCSVLLKERRKDEEQEVQQHQEEMPDHHREPLPREGGRGPREPGIPR
jgi:hypothetical protein